LKNPVISTKGGLKKGLRSIQSGVKKDPPKSGVKKDPPKLNQGSKKTLQKLN